MNKSKVKPVKPAKEIDLNKVSVFQLIQMLEKGDKDAYYMMLTIRSAEARGLSLKRDGSEIRRHD